MSDSAYIVGIILFLIYAIIDYRRVKNNKKKKKRHDDRNIEWYGPNISLKRKHYPHLEMKDDHRQGVEDGSNNNSKAGQGQV